MKERSQIIAFAGVIVLALLLVGLVISTSSNNKSKKSLKAEKLTSEMLLSRNLAAEKELFKLHADFSDLKSKNDANTTLLAETNMKIAENEKKINSLSGENRSLRAYKAELSELKKIRSDLEKESSQLKSDYERLMKQNNDLQNSLSLMEKEKKDLAAMLAQRVSLDNFLITATRGKKAEKVVIKAARAKKLNMNFEIPGNMAEGINFKLVTPSGNIINPDDKALSWYVSQDSRNFTASLSTVAGEFVESRQVVLNYAPKEKLSKGEYKVQIINNGVNIGNCRIMLR